MPTIDIQVRDILQSGADIVVFSAHPSLLKGSGVSGLLHRAAGPELEVFAKSLGPIAAGQSVITPALLLFSRGKSFVQNSMYTGALEPS